MALVQIAEAMQSALEDLVAFTVSASLEGAPVPGGHCHGVAAVPGLATELLRVAAVADRRAGATWEQIGAELGISADAARARYGHIRLFIEQPHT